MLVSTQISEIYYPSHSSRQSQWHAHYFPLRVQIPTCELREPADNILQIPNQMAGKFVPKEMGSRAACMTPKKLENRKKKAADGKDKGAMEKQPARSPTTNQEILVF